jgi:hypothetical protein
MQLAEIEARNLGSPLEVGADEFDVSEWRVECGYCVVTLVVTELRISRKAPEIYKTGPLAIMSVGVRQILAERFR